MMKKTKRITHFNEKNNKTRTTNSLDNDKKQQIKSNVAMILILIFGSCHFRILVTLVA